MDKWLWATRFFKTRSQAAKACSGGKIKRMGESIKPSTVIRVNDLLEIPAQEAVYTRTIKVTQIIEKRVSPALAQESYEESTSKEIIEDARKIAKENRIAKRDGDQGRLTKKKRRYWEKVKGGFFE